MRTSPTVVFTEPGKVVIEDKSVSSPRQGQLLVQTSRTLISTGTELTILSGKFPPNSHWASYGKYPFIAGYDTEEEKQLYCKRTVTKSATCSTPQTSLFSAYTKPHQPQASRYTPTLPRSSRSSSVEFKSALRSIKSSMVHGLEHSISSSGITGQATQMLAGAPGQSKLAGRRHGLLRSLACVR